jgi:tetratricopeptide (TPR) repeat protein
MPNSKLVRLVFLAVIFSGFNSYSAEEDFAQGAKHYFAKEYSEAAESFKRAAAKSPSSDVFLNLGLAEFQLAHYGWAMSYWRKALDLSPWNSSAREAIEHLLTLNKLRRGSEDNSIFYRIHSSLLRYVPLGAFLFIGLILMVVGFWQLLAFAGSRRKAALAGEIPPAFPIKVGVIIFFFVFTMLISAVKRYDNNTVRATIVVSSTPLRTGPTDESANVMEVFEGQEVVVQRLDKDWLQITYAGKTTGWIERKAVDL